MIFDFPSSMVAITIGFHESAFGLIRNDHGHWHPSGSSFHASYSLPLASSHLSLFYGGSKIICSSSSTIEDLHDSEEIGCCKSSRFLTSPECTKLCNLLASYLSCWHLQKSCIFCDIRKTFSNSFCSITFLSSKIWSWDHSFALLYNNLSSSSSVLSKKNSVFRSVLVTPAFVSRHLLHNSTKPFTCASHLDQLATPKTPLDEFDCVICHESFLWALSRSRSECL